jgi:hypothetical protein
VKTEDHARPESLKEAIFAYVAHSEEKDGGTLLAARTTIGELPLRVWRARPPASGEYLLLTAVDLHAAQEELARWKSISLDSKYDKTPNYAHRIVPEKEVPREVSERLNPDRMPQIVAAKRLLDDPSPWEDPRIHGIVRGFAEDNALRFFNAPAATSKHHSWRGGLLVHTAEVAANCMGILQSPMNAPYRGRINGDALLLAAWLHDAGKMDVYRMEGENPAADWDTESMVGHTSVSNLTFADLARENGLEQGLQRLVSHCILSHHERREWGAVVEPQTIEAHILCRADFISSRMPG